MPMLRNVIKLIITRSLVTLQILSNGLLLIQTIKSKTFVLKNLSVYSKFQVALSVSDTEQHYTLNFLVRR